MVGLCVVDEAIQKGGSDPRDRAFAGVSRGCLPIPCLVVDGAEKTGVVPWLAQGGGRKSEGFGETGSRCLVQGYKAVGSGKGEQSCRNSGPNPIDIPKGLIGFECELWECDIVGVDNRQYDVLNCFSVGAEYRIQGGLSHAAEQRPALTGGQTEQALTVILIKLTPVRVPDDIVQDLDGLSPTALFAQYGP